MSNVPRNIYFLLPLPLLFVGTLLIVIPGPVFTLGPDVLEPPLDAEGADAFPRAPRGGGGCDGRPLLLEADLMSMFPILMLGMVTTLDSLILFRVVKKRLSTSRYQPPGGGLIVPLS